MCGIKLLINLKTVAPLKFGNWEVFSSHILLYMWLLISMLGLKFIHVSKRDPGGEPTKIVANVITFEM